MVPDRCCCRIDFRLTPNVDKEIATQWIKSVVNQTDEEYPGPKRRELSGKRAGRLSRAQEHPLPKRFLEAAREIFGHNIEPSQRAIQHRQLSSGEGHSGGADSASATPIFTQRMRVLTLKL